MQGETPNALPRYSPVVVVVTSTIPNINLDGKVDSTSNTDVKSSPNIVLGSSWFGIPPVVIQNVDTVASIEASRASVEKVKWQSIFFGGFFGGGLILFGIAAIVRARKPLNVNEVNLSRHLSELVSKMKKSE